MEDVKHPAWFERLIIERAELQMKVSALREAINKQKVPADQVKVLSEQLLAMEYYLEILVKRVKAQLNPV